MAYYFFGTASGIGKKSGRPWWGVNILRYVVQFNGWTLGSVFCSEKFFNQVNSEVSAGKWIVGCPVGVTTNIDGNLTELRPDDSVDPLDLQP